MDKDNKEKALLSILITTYNRAPILDKQLEILKSYEDAGLCFELVVSNDCSSDNTDEVCLKWKDRFRKMKYIRLTERSGMDKNFMTVYEAFDTEYCWLLGDHRKISYEGLSKIISTLQIKKYTALITNASFRQSVEEKEYTGIKELMDEQGWHITDNSSCIIPRSFIKRELYHRHIGNTFLHMAIMVENLCLLEEFNVLFMPNVGATGLHIDSFKKVGWTCHPFHNFGIWWLSFVLSLPTQIPLELKFKVVKDHNRHMNIFSIKRILFGIYRYGDIFVSSYKENRQYIEYLSDIPRWKYDLFFYCPKPIVSIAKCLYILLFKGGKVTKADYSDFSSATLH